VAGSSGASVAPVPFRGQARYAVLALLSFGDELTGYRELSQLEDQGWVSFREVGTDDRVARAYRLTDEGRDQLRACAGSARFDPRRCGSRWRSRCGSAT
jgi:hypothetical protein